MKLKIELSAFQRKSILWNDFLSLKRMCEWRFKSAMLMGKSRISMWRKITKHNEKIRSNNRTTCASEFRDIEEIQKCF